MKIEKEKKEYAKEAALAITLGTIAGVATYVFFLLLNIAIFGWNLGLVVAPLVAGYVETYISEKRMKKSTGAISALILFLVTVIYGFIIANPTLGVNFITAGSILVILQAAIPTAVNYILIVTGISFIYYFLGISEKIIYFLKKPYYKYIKKQAPIIDTKAVIQYDEIAGVNLINNLGILITSLEDPGELEVEKYLGHCEGRVILAKSDIIKARNYKSIDKVILRNLKEAKDQAIINLADDVKSKGGNGLIKFSIEYDTVGFGGDSYQILAKGTGIIYH